MNPVDYIRATTLQEAVNALALHGTYSRLLAGGTDLLIEWRRPAATRPTTVIDISSITALKGISPGNGCIQLWPLATHAEIAGSPLIREFAPLLSSAASTIGSPQIRNRGTVGGNIMNAAACADTVPPLIALNAEIMLYSLAGVRRMKLADLFLRPYRTNAAPEELLTEICFDKLPPHAGSSFIKLGRRNALSISRLSVAAIVVRGPSGVIEEARIVPGATFPVWRRVREAEAMLIGEHPSPGLLRAAGHEVSRIMIAETGVRWSTAYKEPVIAVLVRRALESCCR